MTDAIFSTVAILDDTGALVERVTNDGYGDSRHHFFNDVDGDGDGDSSDLTTIQNLDGDVITDATYLTLDLIGLIPLLGDAVDLGHGWQYYQEGRYLDAGLSGLALIPLIGTPAKMGLKAIIKGTSKAVLRGAGRVLPWSAGGGAIWGWVWRGGAHVWEIIHDFRLRGGDFGKRGCFIAGTLVLTANGPVPIEEVQAGDQVWSYNIESQEWELREVIEPQVREYDGLILTLTIATEDSSTETIECTDEHPFWVTAGEDLSQRPVVQALAPHEREMTMASHGGRWTEAKWLRIGDHFLTKAGKSATVSGLTIRIERIKVYNLKVAGHRSYTVAGTGVLVHNKEGIYEFRGASGRSYIGQSDDITRRLSQHAKSGKLPLDNLDSIRTREVLGGKRARLLEEQARINELGGPSCLENVRNPIGK